MKGHVDLVIYKFAYLTNDSPIITPGHFRCFSIHTTAPSYYLART